MTPSHAPFDSLVTLPAAAAWVAGWAVVAAVACAPATDDDPRREDTAADALLGDDRDATFADHVERVRAVAVLSDAGFARLGTTWEAELAFVRERYRTAVTDDDVYLALVALQDSLHDGHAYVRADALRPTAPVVVLPLSVRAEVGDGSTRYVVRAGGALPAGSAITSVDGVEVDALANEHRAWFAGGSSPEGLRNDVARWLALRNPQREPAPLPGSPTVVRVRLHDGSEQTATLTWRERDDGGEDEPCPPYADVCGPDADGDYVTPPVFQGLGACVYTTDDPTTRIVRYRTLSTPETRDPYERACLQRKLSALSYPLTLDDADALGPRGLLQVDQGQLLDHLARAGVQRVLFDVRENTGGDFDPVFFGAFTSGSYAQPRKRFVFTPYFRDDPARIAAARPYVALLDGQPVDDGAARIERFLREHPDAPSSPPIPFYCQTPACADGEERLTSRSNIVFRAAVLAGPRCFSACDDFVAILRDNGIASTIGEPTGAGDAPYAFDVALPLHDGTAAALHVTVGTSDHPGTATPLEAHPTTIDVPLPPVAGNRGGYLDAALAAVAW